MAIVICIIKLMTEEYSQILEIFKQQNLKLQILQKVCILVQK
jgi:hypothetical protein